MKKKTDTRTFAELYRGLDAESKRHLLASMEAMGVWRFTVESWAYKGVSPVNRVKTASVTDAVNSTLGTRISAEHLFPKTYGK